MKVSRGLPRPPLPPHPVLTIGNFDGQHIGHRRLLADVVGHARAQRGTPTVVTFDPHPAAVLSASTTLQFLTSPEDKLAWFEAQGVEHLVVLPFTRAFAALSPEEFVFSIVRVGLGAEALFVGEHFVFGKNRAGNVETLHALSARACFHVHVVQPVHLHETVVSSTRIRRLVREGQMEDARRGLGRPYALKGTVIEGDRRGRALGCRTANLRLPRDRVIPPDGVYATTMVWRDTMFPSVSYIGTRPTFGEGERLLEVHVLDDIGDLYGEAIEVRMLRYLRGDEVFENPDQLAARMAQDIHLARQAFTE